MTLYVIKPSETKKDKTVKSMQRNPGERNSGGLIYFDIFCTLIEPSKDEKLDIETLFQKFKNFVSSKRKAGVAERLALDSTRWRFYLCLRREARRRGWECCRLDGRRVFSVSLDPLFGSLTGDQDSQTTRCDISSNVDKQCQSRHGIKCPKCSWLLPSMCELKRHVRKHFVFGLADGNVVADMKSSDKSVVEKIPLPEGFTEEKAFRSFGGSVDTETQIPHQATDAELHKFTDQGSVSSIKEGVGHLPAANVQDPPASSHSQNMKIKEEPEDFWHDVGHNTNTNYLDIDIKQEPHCSGYYDVPNSFNGDYHNGMVPHIKEEPADHGGYGSLGTDTCAANYDHFNLDDILEFDPSCPIHGALAGLHTTGGKGGLLLECVSNQVGLESVQSPSGKQPTENTKALGDIGKAQSISPDKVIKAVSVANQEIPFEEQWLNFPNSFMFTNSKVPSQETEVERESFLTDTCPSLPQKEIETVGYDFSKAVLKSPSMQPGLLTQNSSSSTDSASEGCSEISSNKTEVYSVSSKEVIDKVKDKHYNDVCKDNFPAALSAPDIHYNDDNSCSNSATETSNLSLGMDLGADTYEPRGRVESSDGMEQSVALPGLPGPGLSPTVLTHDRTGNVTVDGLSPSKEPLRPNTDDNSHVNRFELYNRFEPCKDLNNPISDDCDKSEGRLNTMSTPLGSLECNIPSAFPPSFPSCETASSYHDYLKPQISWKYPETFRLLQTKPQHIVGNEAFCNTTMSSSTCSPPQALYLPSNNQTTKSSLCHSMTYSHSVDIQLENTSPPCFQNDHVFPKETESYIRDKTVSIDYVSGSSNPNNQITIPTNVIAQQEQYIPHEFGYSSMPCVNKQQVELAFALSQTRSMNCLGQINDNRRNASISAVQHEKRRVCIMCQKDYNAPVCRDENQLIGYSEVCPSCYSLRSDLRLLNEGVLTKSLGKKSWELLADKENAIPMESNNTNKDLCQKCGSPLLAKEDICLSGSSELKDLLRSHICMQCSSVCGPFLKYSFHKNVQKPQVTLNSLHQSSAERDQIVYDHDDSVQTNRLPLSNFSGDKLQPGNLDSTISCNQCQVCGLIFKTFTKLYMHVKHVHSADDLKSLRRIRCEHCGTPFAYERHLRQHIRAIHDLDESLTFRYDREHSVKPYQCLLCSKHFKCFSGLKGHQKSQHAYNVGNSHDARRSKPT